MPRINGIPKNLAAFLDTLALSEGTSIIPDSDDGYQVLVGATRKRPLRFSDYSRHPHVYNKALNSTAAGRYQIIFSTWMGVANKLRLKDFSPVSQDVAAVELIRLRGALPDIEKGWIEVAIHKCCDEWASLPGGDSGQHQNELSVLLAAYRSLGGVCA